jgi:hypothetical protein
MATVLDIERTTTTTAFPKAGTDTLVSALVCSLDLNGTGAKDEQIVMSNILKVQRSEAYTNAEGLRQIDGRLIHWSAKGYSKLLGATLEYVLSDEEQPLSAIIAEQPGTDFPARVVFNSKFDVKLNGETIVRGMDGTAYGGGWMSVPPDGDDFLTVNKDVVIGNAVMAAGVCEASRSIDIAEPRA